MSLVSSVCVVQSHERDNRYDCTHPARATAKHQDSHINSGRVNEKAREDFTLRARCTATLLSKRFLSGWLDDHNPFSSRKRPHISKASSARRNTSKTLPSTRNSHTVRMLLNGTVPKGALKNVYPLTLAWASSLGFCGEPVRTRCFALSPTSRHALITSPDSSELIRCCATLEFRFT
ncbi:hypothetical protein DF057_25710 [Burkholderia cepacia]|nr:hypothetical protein DF057_25710 [Burkholderia cepacia]